MSSENILVNKAKNGSERAFKKLYELNAAKLYRFLKQFSKDDDLVEDWVQMAFIKAFRKIDLFYGRSKFSTWLFTIAMNEMRADLRRNHNTFIPLPDEAEIHIPDISDFEWRIDMKNYLDELDDNKRAVFILFEVEGYRHDEIAEILQISPAASRTILSRTKKFLREKIMQTEVNYD